MKIEWLNYVIPNRLDADIFSLLISFCENNKAFTGTNPYIASRVGIAESSVTSPLTRLEQAGFINRNNKYNHTLKKYERKIFVNQNRAFEVLEEMKKDTQSLFYKNVWEGILMQNEEPYQEEHKDLQIHNSVDEGTDTTPIVNEYEKEETGVVSEPSIEELQGLLIHDDERVDVRKYLMEFDTGSAKRKAVLEEIIKEVTNLNGHKQDLNDLEYHIGNLRLKYPQKSFRLKHGVLFDIRNRMISMITEAA